MERQRIKPCRIACRQNDCLHVLREGKAPAPNQPQTGVTWIWCVLARLAVARWQEQRRWSWRLNRPNLSRVRVLSRAVTLHGAGGYHLWGNVEPGQPNQAPRSAGGVGERSAAAGRRELSAYSGGRWPYPACCRQGWGVFKRCGLGEAHRLAGAGKTNPTTPGPSRGPNECPRAYEDSPRGSPWSTQVCVVVASASFS